MTIDIKNMDIGGREGVLDIDGTKIKTPDYLPNQKDITNLVESPFVNGSNFPNVAIGTYTQWLDKQKLTLISGDLKEYKKFKKSINSGLNPMENAGVKRKLIHFEFNKDIDTLSEQEIDILLQLQYDMGADVIEVPNLFSTNDYEKALDQADEWRHSKGIKKELMGIANEGTDIEILKNKSEIINSIGVNLRRENQILLFAIKNYLKHDNLWVHAFSVPKSFRVINGKGTMSMLLNYYGIDTISTGIAQPSIRKWFGSQIRHMSEEQKITKSLDLKYFNPNDYSTFKCKDIKSNLKLSTFCNCTVCQNNTIDSLLQDVDTAYTNLCVHDIFSYKNESGNYQNEIKQNASMGYFNSKKYAKEISVIFGV